jgi:phosphatidylglycerol:prolipoprotein diacylglycerol transferase
VRRARHRLALTSRGVYDLTLVFVVGVLAGGRLVEVAFDEWPFYRDHLRLIPAYWLGGMASHGLLLGAAGSILIFCRLSNRPWRVICDELVIPGTFLLAVGRIGNFIDGMIVGSVTDVPWAVKFPDVEGFRHPVVLYDAAKNLAIIPLLLLIRRSKPVPGAVSAHFMFWYAFLRIFVDCFRDYPTHRLALGTGQSLNIIMAVVGVGLLVRSSLRRHRVSITGRLATPVEQAEGLAPRRAALMLLLVFSLMIPSNWTQDVPARYGKRHPGLQHSLLYPRIDTAPPASKPSRMLSRSQRAVMIFDDDDDVHRR